MNLTTADRYMKLFSDAKPSASDVNYAGMLDMRISAISKSVEKYLQRKIMVGEYTDYFTPTNGTGTKSVRVSAFPIVSVQKVMLSGTELDASTYAVDKQNGIVSFIEPITRDMAIPYQDCISVVYTGGMAENTADFISEFPDIEIEVLTQIRFEILRVKDIAMKSVANGQTTSQLNPYGFLDSLINILERYRPIGW